jgi:hypothetical protein
MGTAKRAPASPPSIHQLKVTLKGIRPPIWRRIQVRSTITLAELHDVIQATMGWYDSHLHEFRVGGTTYGDPAVFQDDPFGFGMTIRSERGARRPLSGLPRGPAGLPTGRLRRRVGLRRPDRDHARPRARRARVDARVVGPPARPGGVRLRGDQPAFGVFPLTPARMRRISGMTCSAISRNDPVSC